MHDVGTEPERMTVEPNAMNFRSAAVEFAFSLPTGKVHLCAIHPTKTEINRWSGKPTAIIRGRSFERDDTATALRWVTRAQRDGFGVYFNCNDLRRPLDNRHVKASEGEVSVVHFLHLDADVDKTITGQREFEAARAVLLKQLRAHSPAPSLIINSGNGFGAFWLLWPSIAVTDQNRLDLKSHNKALREAFPTSDACENLDRVMRLPGTLNFPNAAKLKRGLKPVLAGIVRDDRAVLVYGLEDFPLASVAPAATSFSGDAYKAIGSPDIPDQIDPARFAVLDPDVRRLILHGSQPDLNIGDGTRSAEVFYVACDLRRRGWSDGDIIAVISGQGGPFDICAHILDQKQRSNIDQAARVILYMNRNGVVPYAEEFEECDENG